MRAIVSSAFLFLALWAMGGCMRSGHKNQPLFLYKELQDSVEAFVRDSMPTLDIYSDGNSLFTTVILRIEKEDTLVIIAPANNHFVCKPGRDTIIGTGMLGGKICEVVCSSVDFKAPIQLRGIVNDNVLTPYYYRDSSSCLVENQFECDYNIVEKSARLRRMYILNRPNHLEPIKK